MNTTPNKTGYIGVKKQTKGRYSTSVWVKDRCVHLGMFSDPVQAARHRTSYILEHKLRNRYDDV